MPCSGLNRTLRETPGAAFSALVASIQKNDDEAILDVLGHEHKDLVVQTDKEESAAIRKRIAAAASEFISVKEEGDKAIACMGVQCWPYPIPVVKKGNGWVFDTALAMAMIFAISGISSAGRPSG